MGVTASEFKISIPGPPVEAVPLGKTPPACYPQVELRAGSGTVTHPIAGALLENAFVRVWVCASLGGRIIGLFDKRTGLWAIPLPDRLDLEQGGIRGVELNHGIEFLCGPERLNRLGQTDLRIVENSSGGAAAFVFEWFGDTSWHGAVTLQSDGATVTLEQTLLNRSLLSKPLRGGVACPGMGSDGVCDDGEGNGFCLIDPDGGLALRSPGVWATLPADGRLGGRRADSWKATLVPFTGLGRHLCSGQAISIGADGDQLTTQFHQTIQGGKIFLSLDGQTLEAPIDNQPGPTTSTPVGQPASSLDGVLVRGADFSPLAKWPPDAQPQPVPLKFDHKVFDHMVHCRIDPHALCRIPGMEAAAHGWLAEAAARAGDRERADAEMERYLAYNAEDPLGWWLKAAIKRESGLDRTEIDRELPNAHYLAPLEPLLKAEAFLNTPQAQGREPNPLLASVAADPGQASGIVGAYLRHGLVQSAARLADELLRHRPNQMVHLLIAAAHIEHRSMEATAAEHVAAAEKLPLEPPFPYRPEEKAAVSRLAERFPGSQTVSQLARLTGAAKE
ncbi:MAG: hypothetical protein JNM28_09530 [Armatimonadetes bacterium]|nr:hypothetical protein [Armatimonadota bacterium]